MENRWETDQIIPHGDRLEQSGRFEELLGTGLDEINGGRKNEEGIKNDS